MTEHKKPEEKLIYQAELLKDLPVGIVATDASFNITTWNLAAEKNQWLESQRNLWKIYSRVHSDCLSQ